LLSQNAGTNVLPLSLTNSAGEDIPCLLQNPKLFQVYLSSKCVFKDAVNYQGYIAPLVDEILIRKHWWDNSDKINSCASAILPTKISASTTLGYKPGLFIERTVTYSLRLSAASCCVRINTKMQGSCEDNMLHYHKQLQGVMVSY